jgi:hypothetical protein
MQHVQANRTEALLHMHRYVRNTLLMLGVILIVLPAALSDGQERHGPRSTGREVAYVFKGTFNATASSVNVVAGNRHVRRAGLVGQTVAFDLSAARVRVADVNADGMRDAADLHDGDIVTVKARLPRGTTGAGPFAARKVVAQRHKHRHGE